MRKSRAIGAWTLACGLAALALAAAEPRTGAPAPTKEAPPAASTGEARETEAAIPELEVMSRFALPPRVTLRDIRWASRNSAYLVDMHQGVHEVELAEGLPKLRQLAPPARALHLPVFSGAAVTDRWIVVTNGGQLAWKKVEAETWGVERVLGSFHDLAIEGDTLVVLGGPGGKYRPAKFEGGSIVWQTDLSSSLDDWEPLYANEDVPRVVELTGGLGGADLANGSIRFLARGGYVVHPSIVPGLLQLSASGAVKHQWDADELWDESKNRSPELVATQMGEVEEQVENLDAFLAGGNSIEVVLALREGPGIIVREPEGEGARYRLAVLGPEIRWYDLPELRVSARAQIRADVDDQGRILLAGVARAPGADVGVDDSEVVVLTLPD